MELGVWEAGSGVDWNLWVKPLRQLPIRLPKDSGFQGALARCLWGMEWDSENPLGESSPQFSVSEVKRPSQFLLHPKRPSFTLRPCDARFVFWPGDCWCWKGSTGQPKFCNNMTRMPADSACLLRSSRRFWSLFLRLCHVFAMVGVAFWVLGRFSVDRFALLDFSLILTPGVLAFRKPTYLASWHLELKSGHLLMHECWPETVLLL